jgi:hypothetical protein
MSFVRLKKVKGRWYAYRVESARRAGRVVQRVRKYLGPATPAQVKKARARRRRR